MERPTSQGRFTKEQIDAILEEVAGISIDLADDPTLPHLGIRYLHEKVAQCRNFTNRVAFYVQSMARMEREILREQKLAEMDLDFKMQEKLADDPIVRKQPSIEDRKALAAASLRDEQKAVADLRMELLDIQESLKIVRFKHGELMRTAMDIKTQRSLVKDDLQDLLGGGKGYVKPQAKQDGTIEGGLPPAIIPGAPVDPKDILDPTKRPDDMPPPVDEEHAKHIAAFLNRHPLVKKEPEVEIVKTTKCEECGLAQFETPSGITCPNGHGGAGSREDNSNNFPVSSVNYDELLND